MEDMKARIGFAREMARKCHKDLSLPIPVPIEEILEKEFGFFIVKLNDISEKISALVDLDDHYIGINSNHSINHQRFTLAHELGHFMLNHKERKYTEYRVEPGREKSIFETEANEFAAELLMPIQLLKTKFKSTPDLPSLAKFFGVSKEALTYQIMKHRLI